MYHKRFLIQPHVAAKRSAKTNAIQVKHTFEIEQYACLTLFKHRWSEAWVSHFALLEISSELVVLDCAVLVWHSRLLKHHADELPPPCQVPVVELILSRHLGFLWHTFTQITEGF